MLFAKIHSRKSYSRKFGFWGNRKAVSTCANEGFRTAESKWLNPSNPSCKRLLRLLDRWQQVCATNPYRTIFDVWCSDPYYTENHFADAKRDQESGFDYLGARYYGSTFERFMSPDPSGLAYADLANPQSLNLYSYAQNNPRTNTDPTGLYSDHNDPTSVFDFSQFDYSSSSQECSKNGGQFVNDVCTRNGQDFANRLQHDISTNAKGSGTPIFGTVIPNDVGIMTQNQMIAMLKSSNLVYSPLDTRLSKVTDAHPGPNFRSASSICSVHLNILPGTGVNGVPARAEFHLDEYSPLVTDTSFLDPVGAAMHLVNDVIPDVLIQKRKVSKTGNQDCPTYFAGGGQ